MRMLEQHSLPTLTMVLLLAAACTSSDVGESHGPAAARIRSASTLPVCESKWIAAGNNGAKTARYFQVSR